MCGRAYMTYSEDELAARYLRGSLADLVSRGVWRLRYSFAPTQSTWILTQAGFIWAQWGLIPDWVRKSGKKPAISTINARSETAHEKPTFAGAFRSRRCIVPLSGYYEWKTERAVKQPYAIYSRRGGILSAAGLWDPGDPQADFGQGPSFTILTRASDPRAHADLPQIHDRLPVFLDLKRESDWLDRGWTDWSSVDPGEVPLSFHPVDRRVGNPRTDDAHLLDPVTPD